MEELKEGFDSRIRKISLLSNHKQEDEKEPPPKDEYNLIRILFFFFGLAGILPSVFFMTANDYWMYKFKDPSEVNYDSRHRNKLQTNFVAFSSMTHSIPSLVCTLLMTRYGHKINIRQRFLVPMSLIVVIYIVFTLFVEINTDSWQTAFFVLTLIVSTLIIVLQVIFQFSNLTLLSRFPQDYMRIQMYGSSSPGVVSAIIQIICLAIGGSPITTALLYFSTGSLILTVTLILAYVSKYSAFYRHFLGDVEADTERPVYTFSEMKEVTIRIWPIIAMTLTAIATMSMSHPTITTLVVSEGYGHGNQWNDKYFVPVVTFLLSDVMALIGRFFAAPIMTKNSAVWYCTLEITRTLLNSPLFLFCNALPRHHLPVWFPHDWEYALFLSCLQFFRAFFSTCSSLSMPNLLGEKAELGFVILQLLAGITGSIFSFMNTFYVNIL